MTMTTTGPYAESFAAYWDAGWRGILPLPHGKKAHPPTGFTGYDGADPSYADCFTWADDGPANVGLRMGVEFVGVDVDHYDGKLGGDTLAGLVERYGALPPTYLSTSREDGISGIRIYRVPAGTVLPTKMPGIEFIQRHHRYLVAWPSMHPQGRMYRWIDERTGTVIDGVPNLADVPMLPAAWITGLGVESSRALKVDIDAVAAADILAGMPAGDPCDHMLRHAGKAMAGGDRHDCYNEAVLAVVGAGRRGCPGTGTVVGRLRSAFLSELTDAKVGRATRGEAEAEFGRSLMGALAIVAGEPQGTVCPSDVLDWIESLDPAPEVEAEAVEDTPYERAVRTRFLDLRIADDAKGMLATLKAGQAPPLEGVGLRELLAQLDEEIHYRVDGLWPADGRVLLAAAAKSGKTTMVAANLIPSLVDGRPFLGRFDCQPVTGTVVLLNMEVSERTLRRWMRSTGVENVDRVVVANLRGRSSALSLSSEAGRRRFAEFLVRHGAEVVILDPLAPLLASLGLAENENADIATFFSWWSEALAMAGVADDLIVHHTGHAGERSRGASRLLDEPDAIWTLTRAKEEEDDEDDLDPFGVVPMRFLAAYGRDVEMPAQGVNFDPVTHVLTLNGESRKTAILGKMEGRIARVMGDGKLRTKSGIVGDSGVGKGSGWKAIDRMLADDVLIDTGQRTKNGYPLFGLNGAI